LRKGQIIRARNTTDRRSLPNGDACFQEVACAWLQWLSPRRIVIVSAVPRSRSSSEEGASSHPCGMGARRRRSRSLSNASEAFTGRNCHDWAGCIGATFGALMTTCTRHSVPLASLNRRSSMVNERSGAVLTIQGAVLQQLFPNLVDRSSIQSGRRTGAWRDNFVTSIT
jgi:hypothetical protein